MVIKACLIWFQWALDGGNCDSRGFAKKLSTDEALAPSKLFGASVAGMSARF